MTTNVKFAFTERTLAGGRVVVRCSGCGRECFLDKLTDPKHGVRHARGCSELEQAAVATSVQVPRNLEEAETLEDGEAI